MKNNYNIELCRKCMSGNIKKVHITSARLPFWWYLECFDCHCCGKTKLFLSRAIRSWNRQR